MDDCKRKSTTCHHDIYTKIRSNILFKFLVNYNVNQGIHIAEESASPSLKLFPQIMLIKGITIYLKRFKFSSNHRQNYLLGNPEEGKCRPKRKVVIKGVWMLSEVIALSFRNFIEIYSFPFVYLFCFVALFVSLKRFFITEFSWILN